MRQSRSPVVSTLLKVGYAHNQPMRHGSNGGAWWTFVLCCIWPCERVLCHPIVSASMSRRTLVVRNVMRQALHTVHTKFKRRVSMQINRMLPGYSYPFVTRSCLQSSSSHVGTGANEPPHTNTLRLLAFLSRLHRVLFLPSFIFLVCFNRCIEVPVGLLHV